MIVATPSTQSIAMAVTNQAPPITLRENTSAAAIVNGMNAEPGDVDAGQHVRRDPGAEQVVQHDSRIVAEEQPSVDGGEPVVVEVVVDERHEALQVPERHVAEVPAAEPEQREAHMVERPALLDDIDRRLAASADLRTGA